MSNESLNSTSSIINEDEIDRWQHLIFAIHHAGDGATLDEHGPIGTARLLLQKACMYFPQVEQPGDDNFKEYAIAGLVSFLKELLKDYSPQ